MYIVYVLFMPVLLNFENSIRTVRGKMFSTLYVQTHFQCPLSRLVAYSYIVLQ
jgi:hypothetical protein